MDLIWGERARAWITHSDIRTIGDGFITASGRDSDDGGWYVIDHSNVSAQGNVFLGRPWEPYARAAFQYSYLCENIVPAGWSIWSESTPQTGNVFFAEYSNTGCVTLAAAIDIAGIYFEWFHPLPLVLAHQLTKELPSPRVSDSRSPLRRSNGLLTMSVYRLDADHVHSQ